MQVQAAVLNAPNTPLNLETLSIQDPQAGELLIKVLACGVCHTDISVLGRPFPVDQPMVLGHEGVGVVVAVGHAASPFRPGDRVL
jgi:aryl-alcohol dehydrogenase